MRKMKELFKKCALPQGLQASRWQSTVAVALLCVMTTEPTLSGELPVPAAALATLGRADLAFSGNNLIINQSTKQAILNWKSFNIGADSSVQFKQPDASSVALNNIYQNDPSQILGKLSANGQVYLINQNGFVFGKGSQVDVNTLLVSSLSVSDETLQRGITKVLGQDGRAALVGKGEIYQKDADGNFILDPNGNKQKVSIQFLEGSKINAATNGRIIAAAPNVENAGSLNATDGQIMMVAATDKVYLQEASGDPSLRGLIVEVKTGGSVTNTGEINSPKGNATLMGFAVNQAGRISANTSVSANGSIRLLAREGATVLNTVNGYTLAPGSTTRSAATDDGLGTEAKVILKSDSQTIATPDLADKATAVDAQNQTPSKIEVMGHAVEVQKDALVRSNSGKVSLVATDNPVQPLTPGIKNDSKLSIDPGAVIDVSGIKDVTLPVSRNVVTVELRSNELRDSPLQKKGSLYGKKVQVDIRKGTPLADISGAVARIERTVAERSTGGGTLNLSSEGSVEVGKGAKLDFSGGNVRYTSGFVNTTQLIRPDGRTVDIGSADPNATYQGIAGPIEQKYKDFNVNQVFNRGGTIPGLGRFEQGYTDGKSAGDLNIKAAVADLKGEMEAASIAGSHQRTPELAPAGGTLNIDLARTVDNNQSVKFVQDYSAGPLPSQLSAATPLEIKADSIKGSGIRNLFVHTNARIEVASDAQLNLLDGSKLELVGGEISNEGAIVSHAGQVGLKTVFDPSGASNGKITLASGSRFDLSGKWNNDKPSKAANNSTSDTSPVWKNGGSLSVVAQGDILVDQGSEIDVSGGAQRTQDGIIHAGNAGSINLSAEGINGSDLSYAGTAYGFALSGGKGGKLSLASNEVILGTPETSDAATNRAPLIIDPSLLTEGGFQSYHFSSNKSGLLVAPGTFASVQVKTRQLDTTAVTRQSGADIKSFSQVNLEPELSRPAGELNLSLALKAQLPDKNATLTVGKDSLLTTDAGGKINLTSDTSILVDGALATPAGTINLHITPPAEQGELGFLPTQGIWLSDTGSLSALGKPMIYPNGVGRIRGNVLDGGAINMIADRGFIEVASNAQIDVSGASARLDVPQPGPNRGIAYVRTEVGSSGGAIKMTAAEGMQILGNLQGLAGKGKGASGGTLALELNILNRRPPSVPSSGQLPFPTDKSIFEVSQDFPTDVIANDSQTGVPKSQYGLARVSSTQVSNGGFSNLKLTTPDSIRMIGEVALSTQRSIDLNAPILEAVADPATAQFGNLAITSSYVALGSTLVRPSGVEPSSGPSDFTVDASLIDVRGQALLNGFTKTTLASSGDLRLQGIRLFENDRDFLGELATAGDLTLSASQIYPTTLSDFKIAVLGKSDGKISIEGGANTSAPPALSAAGKLTLEAPYIDQGGTIRAPMGEINLKAENTLDLKPGSLTSVSAAGMTIPFGRLQAGLEWIYPLGSQNLVFNTPPEKKISLSAASVNVEEGSIVDVKGGGDLQAFEFLPGPGGSFDRLDPSSPGYVKSFAVIPTLTNGSAPVDPLETATSGLKVGDSVYLSGGGGLKAGNYVLMPAHYALLPGAYLVTPQPGGTTVVPQRNVLRGDGATIVAGSYTVSGTDIRSPIWTGFAVEKGQRALTRSEFGINTANSFYSSKEAKVPGYLASLPQDGGAIQIDAQTALDLKGTIEAAGSGKGIAGQLDVAANNINVLSPTDAGQTAGGSIVISSDILSNLDVSSLSIGALRSKVDGATTLDVKSSNVTIGKDVTLKGAEILLAAKDKVEVDSGASLTAKSDAVNGSGQRLTVEGDAALVRLSSGGQADLYRANASGTSGSIEIQKGATLAVSGALLLDATAENTLAGTIAVNGASLALGAGRISLGEDSRASGLVLSNALLSSLTPSELILSSGSDIGIFGAPSINAKSLTMHTGGLTGYAGSVAGASLTADTITLDNRNNALLAGAGDGASSLSFNAKSLTLGSGPYGFSGFSAVNLNASQGLTAQGNIDLKAASNLNITTPYVTAGRSTNAKIDASGYAMQLLGTGSSAKPASEALGARLELTADSIVNSTSINLPSGAVTLAAKNGNLTLASGSKIDVSGRSVSIGTQNIATDGGLIGLSATNGSVSLANNAALALGGDRGGVLKVAVPQGRFDWQGTIDGKGASSGSSFDLTLGAAADLGSLGALGSRLKQSGFTDAVRLDAATGDLILAAGDTLEARLVSLVAEKGGMDVSGNILSQGKNAEIDLLAARQINLNSSANLVAQGTLGGGGRVVMDTVTLNPGNTQGVAVAGGAVINTTSSTGNANGSVLFRVQRGDSSIALSGPVGSAIFGAANTVVEADKVYNVGSTIGTADAAAWKADALQFMSSQASAYESQFGIKGEVKAGVFLNATGNLSLDSTGLDLATWHVGDRSGVLTFNAGGNVSFLGSLSDGFINNPDVLTLADGKKVGVTDQLQDFNSWSYRILAGNDVIISPDHYVRTGTGDIEVNAVHDISLGNAGSAIYTMGKATTLNRFGGASDVAALQNALGEYPINGGSIKLNAGHDVIGALTGQFFDGWMTRAGNWSNAADHSLETPTSWAVHVGGLDNGPQVAFQQNVGALGGGNVSVVAGNDLRNLSVVVATTGKPVGELANPKNPASKAYLTNEVLVQGGGDIRLESGNDILGGAVYTGRGVADLKAVGSVRASEQTGIGTVLATGAGQYNVRANDRIEVGAALNPTVIADAKSANYFFTYSPDSALNLKTLSGDVVLQNDIDGLVNQLNKLRPISNRLLFPGLSIDALRVYPSSLLATAVQGNIVIDRTLVMYPSPSGSLNLAAGSNIQSEALNNFVYVTMSDADPQLLPSVTTPTASYDDASRRLQPFGPANFIHAQVPVHKNDTQLAQINANGSILGKDPLTFTLPTGANVQAGVDIQDASFSLQHPNYALSTITAGRDLLFTQPRNEVGNLINSAGQIALAGPGQLLASAGRNIDLGASVGMFTSGNAVNSALPAGNGAITVLAGMGEQGPQYAAFAKKYDPLSKPYQDLLVAFVGKIAGTTTVAANVAQGDSGQKLQAKAVPDYNAAQAKFKSLTLAEQNLFLFDILFNEIRQSASAAAKSGKSSDYAQGYAAIDTMFPGAGSKDSPYAGDLSLFFSKISTLSGGDVNMLAPGGSINAGLASSFTGSKTSADLGVVVQGSGSINAQVNSDFMVNQSRVFALNGGDITIWSSNGNIDAGRGAKSALTIPPPEVSFDAAGNLKIIYPPAVSGSGIRTAASIGGRPGDVYLAAPKGVVDAGEAGIGGSNITIAATAVLGANNIQVSGTSTGVPVAGASVPIAPAGAAAAATAAANTAESAVNNDTNQAKERNSMADNAMNPLSVDILGFGECGVADVREGKPGCV